MLFAVKYGKNEARPLDNSIPVYNSCLSISLQYMFLLESIS